MVVPPATILLRPDASPLLSHHPANHLSFTEPQATSLPADRGAMVLRHPPETDTRRPLTRATGICFGDSLFLYCVNAMLGLALALEYFPTEGPKPSSFSPSTGIPINATYPRPTTNYHPRTILVGRVLRGGCFWMVIPHAAILIRPDASPLHTPQPGKPFTFYGADGDVPPCRPRGHGVAPSTRNRYPSPAPADDGYLFRGFFVFCTAKTRCSTWQ
jgi:hypothetical protein